MPAPKWNASPVAFKQTLGPVFSPNKAITSMSAYSAAAILSFLLPRASSPILQYFSFQGYKYILDTTCIALALGFVLQVLNTYAKWSNSQRRVKAQAMLTSTQRSLLGIPPTPVKSPAPVPRSRLSSAAAAAVPSTPVPITPPLQRTRPPSTPIPMSPWPDTWPQHTPASTTAASLGTPVNLTPSASATPSSLQRRTPPSARTRSPATRDVCTPEQLSHYLDAFSKEAQVPTSQEPLYSSYPAGTYNYGGDTSSPAPLPLGRDAPKYHMSWVRKGTTAGHVSDVLQPSTAEEVEEVMDKVLKMSREELDVWTERLREWLSDKLLRPLVRHIQGVHEEVNNILSQLGEPHIRLPPVQRVVTPNSRDKLQMDVDSTIGVLEKRCDAAAAQRPAEVNMLRQALHRYRHLVQLLRGDQPPQLLQPPAPSGYLVQRIQALASGTCVADFVWNGGSPWDNKPWSTDLPTDGAVVLYLLSAFLEAPGWEWGTDMSGGLPLFVGQAPSRPPRQYSLILAKRPDKLGKEVAALVALNLASVEPLYSVYFEGRILTLMPSYLSLFHGVLMFLQFHQTHRNGMLGKYSMANAVLDLAAVVEPVRVSSLVSIPQRVLGWWFPAPDE